MLRLVFLFLITQSISSACALCTVYSPQTQVSLNINSTDTHINSIDVKWILTKDFTEQLKQIYDTNLDGQLDKNELIAIHEAFDDYAKIKNYMAHISYSKDVINKEKSNQINVKNSKAAIENDLLHFYYTIDLNYELKDNYALYIKIDDDENYFILLLNKNFITFKNKANISRILENQSVIFFINKDDNAKLQIIKKDEESKAQIEFKTTTTENKEETILQLFISEVKKYLVLAQKGDIVSIFLLLFVSFIYGIIHAIGPGHGKALAFSYFSSNKSSYSKAFSISLASAFVHIVGALILVMISIFVLESVLNNFVANSVVLLTQISAVMIILLAFYILLQKLKNKQCACSSCSLKEGVISWSTKSNNSLKSNTKIDFEKLNKKTKSDLYFVLTAGLIPCPGTVILFIYAFVLKTYYAVALASIFISLGMGIVIFASSFLGVSLHKVSEKSHNLTRILEIGSPIVMFILGVLLLLGANSI